MGIKPGTPHTSKSESLAVNRSRLNSTIVPKHSISDVCNGLGYPSRTNVFFSMMSLGVYKVDVWLSFMKPIQIGLVKSTTMTNM